MTLQERVTAEIKTAMLAKDAERLSTLRMLKSAFGYAQIVQNYDFWAADARPGVTNDQRATELWEAWVTKG